MNTCATCKYFNKAPASAQPYENSTWGACELSLLNNKQFIEDFKTDARESNGMQFFAMGIQDLEAAVTVSKDFGCNQHEWRGPVKSGHVQDVDAA